jgi:hypothetical protein
LFRNKTICTCGAPPVMKVCRSAIIGEGGRWRSL